MASEDIENEPRARTLAALERFLQRLLPYHVRRSSRWRHACPELRRQLTDELRQELTVDCLSSVAEIDALPERAQNRRWFQMSDRWLYRERMRARTLEDNPMAAPTTLGGFATAQEQESRRLAQQIEAPLVPHRGPVVPSRNVTAFATHAGMSRAKARKTWTSTARRLGYGPEYIAFWRRRLAEALTGLAADLLLDAGVVATLPRKRRAPDPSGRRHRIRRILGMLAVAPMDQEVKAPLAQARLRRKMRLVHPAMLLEAAERLDPWNPTIPPWRFEAATAVGDHHGAALALRRARAHAFDPVAIVLARARLLAARGRVEAAFRLLQRASARRPHDERLHMAHGASLRAKTLRLRQRADSACSTASPNSSSSQRSERAGVHCGVLENMPKPR
jgi:hypothetical protein